MSPRSKYKAVLALWLILSFLLMFTSLYISQTFVILTLLPTFAAGIYMMRMRCPVCGSPLSYALSGLSVPTKPVFPFPERCPKCGHDLNQPTA
jgi:rRNA maturation protein Nop10